MNTNKSSPHNGLTILNKMKNIGKKQQLGPTLNQRGYTAYTIIIEVSVRYSSDICF